MNSHIEEESTDGYDENGYDRPSKSQVKRDMHALLDLGKQLIELSPDRLKQLPLAERLYEAIREAQRTTSREGRRRQTHFVGKLMRDAPADEIRAQLDVWENGSREETAAMHRLETPVSYTHLADVMQHVQAAEALGNGGQLKHGACLLDASSA